MLGCISASTTAQVYYGNGYTIVEGQTPVANTDLNVKVFKTINADTVEMGLSQLLQGSGWRLAQVFNSDPELYRLYRQPYPDYKRTLNPMSLGQALQYIAGDAWNLVVDPVNKLVSFQLKSRYQNCVITGGESCIKIN